MPPSPDKKRIVSRPLSPTHKRRKSAPSIYEQDGRDTQPSAAQNLCWGKITNSVFNVHDLDLPELTPAADVPRNGDENASSVSRQTDASYPRAPSAKISLFTQALPRTQGLHLLSQADDSTHARAIPQSNLSTLNEVLQSRPLRPDMDYKGVHPCNQPRYQIGSQFFRRFGAIETSRTEDHALKARERKARTVEAYKVADAPIKSSPHMQPPPHTKPRNAHRFLASETLAIGDHVLKTRKKRARVARQEALRRTKRPQARYISPPKKAASVVASPAVSISLESSSSLSPLFAPSPLDLGSPASDLKFPLSLRSPRVRPEFTSDHSQIDSNRYLNGNPITFSARKSPLERVVSDSSEQHGPFKRSGCPSPSPSLQISQTISGANADLNKSLYSITTNTASPRSPWSGNSSVGRQPKIVSENSTLRTLDEGKGELRAMHGDASKDLVLKDVFEAPMSSSSMSSSCSVMSRYGSDNKFASNAYKVRVTESTAPFLDIWTQGYPPFAALEPIIVFPFMIRGMPMQATKVNGDGDRDNTTTGSWTENEVPLSNNNDALEPKNMSPVTVIYAPVTLNDDGPLEPFPDIAECDLHWSGNMTDLPSNARTESPLRSQNSGVNNRDGDQKSRNFRDSTNGRSRAQGFSQSTRGIETDGNTVSVDPSLPVRVHHRATPRTPEPTLGPKEGEPGPSDSRRVLSARQKEKCPASDDQQSIGLRRSLDSLGIEKPDIDAVFRRGPLKHHKRDLRNYPILQNILSVSGDPVPEPSGTGAVAITVPTAPPSYEQQVDQTTPQNLDGAPPDVPGERVGEPDLHPPSVSAGVQATGFQQHMLEDQIGEAREAHEAENKGAQAERKKSDDVEQSRPPLGHIPPTPSRRRRIFMAPRRRRATTASSEEAGCLLCGCMNSFRSFCCGRKAARGGPTALHERQADAQDTSPAPLSSDRLLEHTEQTGHFHTSNRGSTDPGSEPFPHQRESAQDQGHLSRPQNRVGGMNVPTGNGALSPIVDADNESLTAARPRSTSHARPASRPTTPSAFFENRKPLPREEREAITAHFDGLKRLKETAKQDGESGTHNGGIRPASTTPPTWSTVEDGEEFRS